MLAPFDGVVTSVESLQPGQYLAAASAAFGLVSTRDVWVEAFPKETQLTWAKPGDHATVTVDTYPGMHWDGVLESLSPASGSKFFGAARAERQRQLGQGRAAHSHPRAADAARR